MIRSASHKDASQIAEIYNHYIEHTTISFEETPVDTSIISQRMDTVQRSGLPWLVIEQDGELRGYGYLSPWKERSAYRFSAEVSVYLQPAATGQGLGSALFDALLNKEQSGLHFIAGVIALHEKFGFKKIAHLREVGFKFGQWLDVGYWQINPGS